MGVFTFVCRESAEEWTAKQFNGELEASAGSTYDLQRKLVQAALSSDSSGAVQSSFSYITPSSAVFQGLEGEPCYNTTPVDTLDDQTHASGLGHYFIHAGPPFHVRVGHPGSKPKSKPKGKKTEEEKKFRRHTFWLPNW